MTTPGQLVLTLVVAAVAVVAAGALALALIPELSLEATIRGAVIALTVMFALRLALWLYVRGKQRRG